MTLYIDDDDQAGLLKWAKQRIEGMDGEWSDYATALAIRDDAAPDDPLAVLVLVESYTGILDVHFASDRSRRWATRNILRGLFGYAFLVRKAFRLQSIHGTDKHAATKAIMAMGFRVEATLDNGLGEGIDGVLFSMTRKNCPWLDDEDKRPPPPPRPSLDWARFIREDISHG